MKQAFYYFSTYLAARVANMSHCEAQLLAKYNLAMAENASDPEHRQYWQYQGYRFTPCSSSGSRAAELSFQALPSLPQAKGALRLSNRAPKKAPSSQSTPQDAAISITPEPLALAMLNDSLYKSCYQPDILPIRLALLGCRLHAYQNHWFSRLKEVPPSPETSSEADDNCGAEHFLHLLLWTIYIIRCHVQSLPVQNIDLTQLRLQHQPLTGIVRQIFMQTDPVIHRQLWLNALPQLLKMYRQSLPAQELWRDGLDYRPGQLLTQAMMASGAGSSRKIRSLAGFKTSPFFKLHKAMEYHSRWLEHKLAQGGDATQIAQSTGNIDMWRII